MEFHDGFSYEITIMSFNARPDENTNACVICIRIFNTFPWTNPGVYLWTNPGVYLWTNPGVYLWTNPGVYLWTNPGGISLNKPGGISLNKPGGYIFGQTRGYIFEQNYQSFGLWNKCQIVILGLDYYSFLHLFFLLKIHQPNKWNKSDSF